MQLHHCDYCKDIVDVPTHVFENTLLCVQCNQIYEIIMRKQKDYLDKKYGVLMKHMTSFFDVCKRFAEKHPMFLREIFGSETVDTINLIVKEIEDRNKPVKPPVTPPPSSPPPVDPAVKPDKPGKSDKSDKGAKKGNSASKKSTRKSRQKKGKGRNKK